MGTKTETAVAKKASKTPVKSTTATKAKSVKVPKLKKLADPTKARSHPPYIEMVEEAILALKERTGSSQYAIAKYIEEKHKENLPPNFKKILLVQLRKHVASGKLTKIKNSFKLSATVKSVKSVKPVKLVNKLPVKAKVATPLKAKKAVVKVKAVTKKALPAKTAVKKVVSRPKKSPAKALKKPKSIKSPAKKSAVKKAKK